jgi:ATP-binding cassette subfamily F protein 3
LATRIWNVEGGTVETYPGTLDEYMDTCRKRQEAEEATSAAGSGKQPAKAAKQAPPPKAAATPAPPKAAQQQPKPAPKSKNRQQKLEREVAELEAKIGELETLQKQRSDLLADPSVYADKERSNRLLQEFRETQPELEKLTARWEQAQLELDGAES